MAASINPISVSSQLMMDPVALCVNTEQEPLMEFAFLIWMFWQEYFIFNFIKLLVSRRS